MDLNQIFIDFEGKSAASFFYKNKKSDHSAACRWYSSNGNLVGVTLNRKKPQYHGAKHRMDYTFHFQMHKTSQLYFFPVI